MTSLYPLIKQVHVMVAFLSGGFFLLRGLWMMQESSLLNARVVRVLPHIIDTVLLLSALVLLGMMGSLPLWVVVKVAALFVYVLLAVFAFRIAKSYGLRVFWFFMAMGCYGFILSVAYDHQPYGFLPGLLS